MGNDKEMKEPNEDKRKPDVSNLSSTDTSTSYNRKNTNSGDGEVDENGFKIQYMENSNGPVYLRPHNWFTRTILRPRVKPIPFERPKSPKSYKNPLSLLTWSWVTPVLHAGYNRILEVNDVFLISEDERNELRMRDYHKKLKQYKSNGKRVPYAECWAMLYAIRWSFIMALVTAAFFIAGEIGMSLMSRSLITAVEDIYTGKAHGRGHGVAFAIGSTLVQLGFQWFNVWYGYRSRYVAEICRTMLISGVYDKLTKLSPTGRQMYPAGRVTSVITTDTNRVYMAARWTAMVIMFLPGFGGTIAVLVHNLGVSGLPGAGLVLLGIVVNVCISRIITMLRRRSLPFADARIATVRETVENMRVIKFYGWENSFVKMVAKARFKETSFLKKLGMIEGLVDATLTSIPQFGGILSFAVRIIIGKNLDPEVAFPSLTLFQLFVPLSMMFSSGITSHADAWASVKRLEEFFAAPEEANYVVTDSVQPGAVQISNGGFKWDVEEPTPAQKTRWRRKMRFYKRKARIEDETDAPGMMLVRPTDTAVNDYEEEKERRQEQEDAENQSPGLQRAGAKKFPGLLDINIDVKPKSLVMVVGAIGCGKTTLLSSICGLVSKTSGSVNVGGSVVTVMSMWSQNATIRDNILFGKDYDEKRYAKTIHVCSLESDLEGFASRDFTEVGERGITLSGGQKARIALARCVYTGGDVVLLDDVLSAVDSKVARHIFKNCVKGMMRESTRIMVTHNWKLLSEADQVIYMTGDGHAKTGTLSDLLKSDQNFNRMYKDALDVNDDDSMEDQQQSIDPNLKHVREEIYNDAMEQRRTQAEDYDEVIPNVDVDNMSEIVTIKSHELKPQLPNDAALVLGQGKLMQEEARARGTVKGAVLRSYLSSGARIGLLFIPIILIIQACVATGQVMQSVFLQFWTSGKYHHPNGFFIGIYCLIVFLRAVFFVGMAVSICIFCFNSSSKLHNQAVETIYRAPMWYFDSTPLGRIINRFTDDTANLDTQLFMQLRMALFSASMLLASIITVFVYVPYAIIALAPIIAIGFVLLNYYRATARELKRINSMFRSSMFTLVTETISGVSVILSYGRAEQFSKELDKRIDNMNVSFQLNLASQYWLSLRMAVTTLIVSFIVQMLSVYQVFGLDASKVGNVMTLLPSISMSIVMLLPMLAELENQMNSVERLHELAYSLPQEAPYHIADTAPPPSWPQVGRIVLDNASLRYRPDLPAVLNQVSLDIKGGEKVGICGRTGAGKSTLLSALFRITELSGGRVLIDDVDISTIGLDDLRTKLSIIPQEPVLFRGTIRSNLDPFNQNSDAELWDALRRSGVVRRDEFGVDGNVSTAHKFHLDTKIDSDGSNFSLGERQLLTLARALVRNAKIIVLDEATATVDFETDKMIQSTIMKEFNHCTIMCIAHRLQTIINYDQVMVMDKGRVIEMGPPKALFDKKDSIFYSMCRDSGITEANFLPN